MYVCVLIFLEFSVVEVVEIVGSCEARTVRVLCCDGGIGE